MDNLAVCIKNVGKRYNLYPASKDRLLDAFGLLKFFPWRNKHVQPFWALRGISLEIPCGQRIALIGRNGSGKSTLLKLVCGNIPITEGELQVNGKIQALMEMGTAFHPDFTGRENIRSSLAYHGMPSENIQWYEEDIEDFVELGPFMDQPVKTYSSGMYARLAFATATSVSPNILIVDEILGAGDAYFASKCAERMKRLTQETGATLLFVSHDLSSVQQMCDRAIWIDRGHIIMDGTPLDVSKAYYADIVQLEEQRMASRNKKTGNNTSFEVQPDVMLFCLNKADGSLIEESHAIHCLRLEGDGFQLEVFPGSPMDNDCSQSASIIATNENGWQKPVPNDSGFIRHVYGSGQAAFQFVQYNLKGDTSLKVFVVHKSPGDEVLNLNIYNGYCYIPLGQLSTGESVVTDSFVVPESVFLNENVTSCDVNSSECDVSSSDVEVFFPKCSGNRELQRIRESKDKFSSNYAAFKSIEITDGKESCYSFIPGSNIHINVVVTILQDLPKSFFTMAIYSNEGLKVFADIWHIHEMYVGNNKFSLTFFDVPLRQGQYVLSFTIIDKFPKTHIVNKFFCEWNRTHTIKIEEKMFDDIPRGIVAMKTMPNVCEPIIPSIEVKKPSVVYVTINNECNLFCKTCDVGQNNANSQFFHIMKRKSDRVLDKHIMKKFIDEISEFKPMIAFIGTEPLLYKDIFVVVKMAHAAGLYVQLTTNGLLLPNKAEELVESGIDSLWVSLDGTSEIHNSVRGHKRSFERAIEGMKKVCALSVDKDLNIDININYTISVENTSCLYEFAKIINDLGIKITSLVYSHFNFVTNEMAKQHNELHGDYVKATASSVCSYSPNDIDIEVLQEQIKALKEGSWNFPIAFTPDIDGDKVYEYYYNHQTIISKKRCEAPYLLAQLQSNGDFVVAARCFDITLGNIFDSSFEEVWNGEKYKKIRKWTLGEEGVGELAPACKRCCGAF